MPTSIPICVESGIYTTHALVESAAVSARLGVLPLKYLALATFEPVVARALVWVHAHTMAHALFTTRAVVPGKLTLFVPINKVEQTCLGFAVRIHIGMCVWLCATT